MSMSSDVSNWIGTVAAIFAVLSIIVGIIRYLKEQRDALDRENLGPVCFNERAMGYFVVHTPSWLWAFVPCIRRTTQVPHILTLTGFIKAGDSLAFTSALFSSIHQTREQVSWKPLLEALFDELVWTTSDFSAYPDAFSPYIAKAKERVAHLKHLQRGQKAGHLGPIPGESTALDRHFLYAAEEMYFAGQDTEAAETVHWGPPYLISCVRPLPTLKSSKLEERNISRFETKPKFWDGQIRELWVFDGKPCIEVSEEALAAVALILGMSLSVTDSDGNPVKGVGAFETLLTDITLDGIHRLRLTMHSQSHSAPKGSGYSTRFAKHLSCSSLPFAESTYYVESIFLNEDTLDAVKRGRSIFDSPHFPDLSEKASPSLYYLDSLPGAKKRNYYAGVCDAATMGQILSETHPVGNWSNAVAEIAFGGLVPFASLHIIKAVAFTSTGGVPFSEDGLVKFLTNIEMLVNKIHCRTQKLEIFGSAVTERVRDTSTINYVTYFGRNHHIDARVATIKFARYSTMLERLVAEARMLERNPAEEVFAACCDELRQCYFNAVGRFTRKLRSESQSTYLVSHVDGSNPIADGIDSRSPSGDEICRDLDNILTLPPPLGIQCCGKIARYLIAAWSYQVGVVDWGKNDGGIFQEYRPETDLLTPPQLKLLPDISALS